MNLKNNTWLKPTKLTCAKFVIGITFLFNVSTLANALSLQTVASNSFSNCKDALLKSPSLENNKKKQTQVIEGIADHYGAVEKMLDNFSNSDAHKHSSLHITRHIEFDNFYRFLFITENKDHPFLEQLSNIDSSTGIELTNNSYKLILTPFEKMLFESILEGDITLFNTLIKSEDVDINKKNVLRTTPLILATEFGNFEMVEALLKSNRKVQLNKIDEDGNTAIMRAAALGHIKIVDILLKQKTIDVLIRNSQGDRLYDIYSTWFKSLEQEDRAVEILKIYRKIWYATINQIRTVNVLTD